MTIMPELVAFFLMADLSVRFSAAHFTYALIAFALFLIFYYVKNRTLSTSMDAIRVISRGFLIFYGLLFLTALLLWDKASMRMALDYAEMVIPFFMLYFVRQHFSVDRGIEWGILLAGAITCSFGLYQHFVLHINRVNSFFAHPNSFGTYLFMLVAMTVYYLWQEKGSVSRLVIAGVLLLEMVAFFFTDSRGSIAGLFGGVLLSLGLWGWQKRKQINKRVILAAVSAVLVLLVMGFGYMHFSKDATRGGGERVLMIEASMNMWEDHKLLGVGLANWQVNYYSDTYHPAAGREKGLDMPHNMPAYFLSTSGLVGFLGYLSFWVLSLYGLYRSQVYGADKRLLFAMYVIFFAFTLQGLVDATIINKLPAKIYFALMGYYFGCCRRE